MDLADGGSAVESRRTSPRRKVLIGGIVTTREGTPQWECVIKNVSEGGALIQLGLDLMIPESCVLINLLTGEVRCAHVKWVRFPLCGLEYDNSDEALGITEPVFELAKGLVTAKRG